jgi:hypothetical protein
MNLVEFFLLSAPVISFLTLQSKLDINKTSFNIVALPIIGYWGLGVGSGVIFLKSAKVRSHHCAIIDSKAFFSSNDSPFCRAISSSRRTVFKRTAADIGVINSGVSILIFMQISFSKGFMKRFENSIIFYRVSKTWFTTNKLYNLIKQSLSLCAAAGNEKSMSRKAFIRCICPPL